nr:MAG: hypothetical protein H4Bulk461460_000002 [Mitovirus sp.]
MTLGIQPVGWTTALLALFKERGSGKVSRTWPLRKMGRSHQWAFSWLRLMQSRMGIGGASSKGYPLDCMGYFVNPMHRRSPEVEGSPALRLAPLLAVR